MGEAILVGRISNGTKSTTVLRTEVITSSVVWNVPLNIVNNTVSVRAFGGGGSTNYNNLSTAGIFGGGGGGNMNNGSIGVSPGEGIQITIGQSYPNSSGGTTSFGSYLSASGGESGLSGGGNGGSGDYGGGGGGYGDNGGTNAGGGGGYGHESDKGNNSGGGGGYFSRGGNDQGGGGGYYCNGTDHGGSSSYGCGANASLSAGYGGGGWYTTKPGGPGICIIQYKIEQLK